METDPTVVELVCEDCGASGDAAAGQTRCPDCDGPRTLEYAVEESSVTGNAISAERFDGIARYAPLLPFGPDALVTMDEGTTPLVECPALATDLGVESVSVKNEGANPTGSVADRALALAVTAASAGGATDVALPTPGSDGLSAAAYAARAGLDAHAFVPSRTQFDHKAMINVHGGDMNVVGGRYDDAAAAYRSAMDEHEWSSVAAGETPYREAGSRTIAYELAEQLGWESPDAIVVPTGHGETITGIHRGAADLVDGGVIADAPRCYAAQAAGCAPIVAAFDDDRQQPAPWDRPDTICGDLEIPKPAAGERALSAIGESGGGAVSVTDEDALARATSVASTDGVGLSASGGVAASAAASLAERGAFDSDDTIVIVDTLAGSIEADVLRSHLMSQGV